MKRVVKNILLIIMAIILLEIVVSLFKTHHKINYKIINNDKTFDVVEIYKNNNYYLKISLQNKDYTFTYSNNFYKTKNILKNIEYYEKDDLSCIYPILKKDNYLDIICLKNNALYSYNYLKDEVLPFVESLKSKGYNSSSWSSNEKTKRLGDTFVYQKNILNDTYIYIWKYNGFYSINNKKLQQINLFNDDTYINNLGVLVDKYYVLPDYDLKYEYNKFYILNMTNNKVKELNLKKKTVITNDYYNNGVVSKNLYLFDVDNMIQYKINPKRNSYEVVGNNKLGGLYYENNNFETRNIYEFKKDKLIFNNSFKIPKEIINYDLIFNYKDNYYYTYEDDIILYNDSTKDNIYLLNLSNVNSISLVEDVLYFIKDDTLYSYNIYYGLKKLITYDELIFNNTNRYVIYKK